MTAENKRAATELDSHLGTRIKLARVIAGISQAALADEVNITFQQIQKYETGSNRIPASRLYNISQALNQDIQFFFSGSDEVTKDTGLAQKNEHLDLIKAYSNITNDKERQVILEMIKSYKKN